MWVLKFSEVQMNRIFVDPEWAAAAAEFEKEKSQTIFLYLLEHGSCYANEIARGLDFDVTDVRHILDYLVQKNLVTRSVEDNEPVGGIYYPTKKGVVIARNLGRLRRQA